MKIGHRLNLIHVSNATKMDHAGKDTCNRNGLLSP